MPLPGLLNGWMMEWLGDHSRWPDAFRKSSGTEKRNVDHTWRTWFRANPQPRSSAEERSGRMKIVDIRETVAPIKDSFG
jgi:hypothetical protein